MQQSIVWQCNLLRLNGCGPHDVDACSCTLSCSMFLSGLLACTPTSLPAAAAAGAISGMVGICAGQPLDTLRVRLQQRGAQQLSTAGILRASGAKAGARDLFRGMSYPLYTIALQVCAGC